jgi:hypothetical protein
MAGNGQDGNRMFGVPVSREARANQPAPQRVLGFPVTMFSNVDTEFFRGFVHPVKAYRRWSRRRRLGAYAVDDDTPSRNS